MSNSMQIRKEEGKWGGENQRIWWPLQLNLCGEEKMRPRRLIGME